LAQVFEIPIPNERLKTYKWLTFAMLTLNFLGFGFVLVMTKGSIANWATILLFLNVIPWCYFLLNKKHIKFLHIAIIFACSTILWFLVGNSILAILLVLFTGIGFYANKPTIIQFSETEIVYPSFPPKIYAWQDVVQVICKDDILSIDLKNNTFIQHQIDKVFGEKFDQVKFNSWCANQVAAI
jgi:hypothetical protein